MSESNGGTIMRVSKAAMVTTLLLIATSAAQAGGEINLLYGNKSLDGEWEPLDGQTQYAVLINIGDQWPVSLAVDLLFSSDEVSGVFPDGTGGMVGATLTAETNEIDIGVRKLFLDGVAQPYVGGGLGLIGGELGASAGGVSLVVDDATIGLWVDGGVMFRVTRHFNVGLDVRWSDADIDFDLGSGLGNAEVNAGGTSYGVMLGYRWGN